MPLLGCDFISRAFPLSKDRKIKLNIWDTAGQEKYRSINRNFYLGAHGVIICFDLTKSLDETSISSWITEVNSHVGKECVRLIAGTKCDGIVDPDTEKTLSKYATENKLEFIKTSALEGTNIYKTFETLVTLVDENTGGALGELKSNINQSELDNSTNEGVISRSVSCCK